MTLRHLTIFICVCDVGKMTKAAEKLHMTQPSVSQAIRELEEHYQSHLFERLGRKLYITEAGRKLLTYARHIVNLNQEIEVSMQQFAGQYPIRIGASVTIGEGLLVELIGKLKALDARRKIFSEVHNTFVLENMLLKDALDIALVEGKVKSEYLRVVPFLEDELVFIVGADHPLADAQNLALETLSQQEFFLREEGSGTRVLFEKMMRERHIPFRVAGVYNNAETIKKAVAAGLGISVISQMAVRSEVQKGILRKFLVEGLSFRRSFSMVYHKNKYLSAGIQAVMAECLNLGEIGRTDEQS